jgi:class 3 adenylate cyclase
LLRELTCGRCGASNASDQKFCNECGTPLEPVLPSERNPRAYTPRHLADRVLRSRSALEGERKQVTVMFADVKDSTGLSQRLGPEQWHTILDRFLSILSEGVHRFEGTVTVHWRWHHGALRSCSRNEDPAGAFASYILPSGFIARLKTNFLTGFKRTTLLRAPMRKATGRRSRQRRWDRFGRAIRDSSLEVRDHLMQRILDLPSSEPTSCEISALRRRG